MVNSSLLLDGLYPYISISIHLLFLLLTVITIPKQVMQYIRQGGERISQLWQRVQDSRYFPSVLRRTTPAESVPPEPEVTHLIPGLFTESGIQLFESPRLEYTAALHAADPRIEYFRFRVPQPDSDQWYVPAESVVRYPGEDDSLAFYNYGNSLGVAGNLFANKLVIPQLTDHLRERFGNFDTIGLRGTACVVDRSREVTLPNSGKKLKTPVEIVQEGVETEGMYAPMTGFHPKENRTEEIGHRTVQWVMDHPQQLRGDLKKAGYSQDDIASIFPLLLVYDRSRFPEGSTALPEDPEERKKCILAAYVLDYPLTKLEVLAQ